MLISPQLEKQRMHSKSSTISICLIERYDLTWPVLEQAVSVEMEGQAVVVDEEEEEEVGVVVGEHLQDEVTRNISLVTSSLSSVFVLLFRW